MGWDSRGFLQAALEKNTRIFNSGISRHLRWAGSAYALRSWELCRITLVPVLATAALTDCARACVLRFAAVLLPIHIVWLDSTNVKTLTVLRSIECSANAQKLFPCTCNIGAGFRFGRT